MAGGGGDTGTGYGVLGQLKDNLYLEEKIKIVKTNY